MKKYNVNFSYTIMVEAESKEGAEDQACQDFQEMPPRLNDMGIETEEREEAKKNV